MLRIARKVRKNFQRAKRRKFGGKRKRRIDGANFTNVSECFPNAWISYKSIIYFWTDASSLNTKIANH